MSSPRVVTTPNAPAALGAYSQAVVAGGFVFCSGQIALDPETGEMIAGDAPRQAERALDNLRAVLEAAGSSLGAVVRCTLYLADMADFAAVNEVYGRYFPHGEGDAPPSRACIAAAGLPKGARVEIDCVALAAE